MSDKPNDGGPAFPFVAVSEATGQPINGCFDPGMSLRDWFAGQALAGLLASGVAAARGQTCEDVAEIAYANADAMLAERAKGGAE